MATGVVGMLACCTMSVRPLLGKTYRRDRFGNSNTAHYYVPMGCMTLPKKGVVRVVIAHSYVLSYDTAAMLYTW